ncbi:ABC transporter ATP-binding protein [Rahnella aquatilis]|uniref:ABC-type proline/glycine betaine transport system, ATPase component n=1 Tax=Rahnella aquatilis (strain ATCC 33071 / DSM 4594 / JCM 1683 / NBRC 105701 / NCIMB 13365 / CIP 78.65) TaxID=745277 RepID=H2IXT1_RAHAC|nr:ATP-binding cassette domain-containing protein [Rahnella aquatilis]AEX51956.1 ABC-type proline/glycine betaine transport system, ATPase component [Rahnella aquatilis CIP 78.65 = ATCC 33071]KFD14890.1 permease component of an ABC superfamily L-proline/glycine/betaine transporter [Rahnella aquatilis CIP 78.65 = ATCC 33071]
MISFENISKFYADGTVAVDRLSFSAPTGKITMLVGPSGCGKTTSLRMINRLTEPSSGNILLNGQPAADMDLVKLRRKMGYVIQNAGLFPHKTVQDNIAVTALLNGATRTAARKKALGLLELVGLSLTMAERYPWQLSGGQQQRVGVARALASDPEFMLMDEPFSAVDPVVREQLQDEFLRLQGEIGKTIIMVTHDIDEAMKLGDQVAVFRPGGRLAQIASPVKLLNEPQDAFVADFIGRDRGYRKLSFDRIPENISLTKEPVIAPGISVSEARALAGDNAWLLVVENECPLGWYDVTQNKITVDPEDINLGSTFAPKNGTLRQLMDSVLSSPCQRGIVVDEHQRFIGTANIEQVFSLSHSRAVR